MNSLHELSLASTGGECHKGQALAESPAAVRRVRLKPGIARIKPPAEARQFREAYLEELELDDRVQLASILKEKEAAHADSPFVAG